MRSVIFGHVVSFYIYYFVGNILKYSRYPPFDGKTEEKIMEKVKKGTYSFDSIEWEDVSKEGKEFIKKMLQYDSSKRYSA